MELQMAATIIALRRKNNLTQEQLADIVGVSAPAVSKWETGNSYPDITLLPALASALNTTIDNLLSFDNNPSEQKVNLLEKELIQTFEKSGFDYGMKKRQALLEQYPNSNYLKFRLGNFIQRFGYLKPEMTEEEVKGHYWDAISIYKQVADGSDSKLSVAATYILSSYYIMVEEYSKAKEMLDSLPQQIMQADDMYASLYERQNNLAKAENLRATALYKDLNHILITLLGLINIAQKRKDYTLALHYNQLQRKLVEIFEIQDINAYELHASLLLKTGDIEQALTAFETYIEKVLAYDLDYTKHPIFCKIELKAQQDKSEITRLKDIVKTVLEQTDQFALLKTHLRYQAAFNKLL